MKKFFVLSIVVLALTACSMGTGDENGVEKLIGTKWISENATLSTGMAIQSITFTEGKVSIYDGRKPMSGTYDNESLFLPEVTLKYSTDYEKELVIIDGSNDIVFIRDYN